MWRQTRLCQHLQPHKLSKAADVIAWENSWKLMQPSPSVSASLIIPVSSFAVSAWPNLAMEWASSAAVMYPLSSLSNIRKIILNCSSLYGHFAGISSGSTSATNSENSIRPLLFLSAFWINESSWSSLGFRPSDLSSDPSSSWVKLPSLFRSNDRKISRSSPSCSSSSFTGSLALISPTKSPIQLYWLHQPGVCTETQIQFTAHFLRKIRFSSESSESVNSFPIKLDHFFFFVRNQNQSIFSNKFRSKSRTPIQSDSDHFLVGKSKFQRIFKINNSFPIKLRPLYAQKTRFHKESSKSNNLVFVFNQTQINLSAENQISKWIFKSMTRFCSENQIPQRISKINVLLFQTNSHFLTKKIKF